MLLPLILGLGAGIIFGMMGSGGSILTLPILIYILKLDVKEAIVSSLFVVGVTALGGLVKQAKENKICYKASLWFGGTSFVFTVLGAHLAKSMAAETQMMIFSGVMLGAAALLFYKKFKGGLHFKTVPGCRISKIASVGGGSLVGLLAGVVGVGGGFVIVPALSLSGLEMSLAMGTSMLVIAGNSSVGILASGHLGQMPWETIVPFAISGAVGSYVGVVLSHKMGTSKMELIFPFALLVLAFYIIIKTTGVLL